MEAFMNFENYNKGSVEFKKNNYTLSAEYYTIAINENDILGVSFSQAFFYRACSYYYLNEFEKAITDFDEAQNAFIHDFRFYLFRGLSYFKLENYKRAITDFNKVVELKSDFIDAYIYLYEIYKLNSSEELAKNTLNKIIEQKPNNINKIGEIALKYLNMDFYELSRKMYLDIYNKHPTSLLAIQGMALSNGHLKNHKAAIEYFDMLINLDNENAEFHIQNKNISLDELNKAEENNMNNLNIVEIVNVPNNDEIKITQLTVNEQRVLKWQEDVLNVMTEKKMVDMNVFFLRRYGEDENSRNKKFMEDIVFRNDVYLYLISKGLVNVGFCPITGENIDQSYNYTMFGRKIFLSEKGMSICNEIKKNDYKKLNISNVPYEKMVQKEKNMKLTLKVLSFIISFYLSYQLINPSGIFSILFFLILGAVLIPIISFLLILLYANLKGLIHK